MNEEDNIKVDIRWNRRVLTELMWMGIGAVEDCVSMVVNFQVP
jgi:hypothetical protein